MRFFKLIDPYKNLHWILQDDHALYILLKDLIMQLQLVPHTMPSKRAIGAHKYRSLLCSLRYTFQRMLYTTGMVHSVSGSDFACAGGPLPEDLQKILCNLLMRIEIPDEVRNKARTAAEAGGDIFTDEQLDKLVRQHHLQDAALFHPASPIVQVASLAGANFRLLSWMLTLLSGTNDWCDRCDWNVGKYDYHSSPRCALSCTLSLPCSHG